jgi:hypothetical protein
VIIIDSPGKPTYESFFNKINESTGPDDINIICNSDIFLDETIALTSQLKDKEMWALSRWDWKEGRTPIHFNREDSQDVWIVKGKIENVYGDFTLGRLGCDNRIAHEFHKAGYRVTNPSLSVKTFHVHNSQVRNYTQTDVVPPPYYTIKPTRL